MGFGELGAGRAGRGGARGGRERHGGREPARGPLSPGPAALPLPPPPSKNCPGFPPDRASTAAAQGRSPFPTTRGLGLEAQDFVDFLEGQPAARRGQTRPPPPRPDPATPALPSASLVGAGGHVWAHRPPSSPAPGCRPEARGARVPSDASWRRGPAGEGRQLGQSVQRPRRAQVLAEDRCQLQKGLQLVPPHPKRQSPISTPRGLRHWNLFPMLFQSVNVK